jgi:hypothetical protein
MSAKHEKALAFLRFLSLYAAEAATLQARMPAVQSRFRPQTASRTLVNLPGFLAGPVNVSHSDGKTSQID